MLRLAAKGGGILNSAKRLSSTSESWAFWTSHGFGVHEVMQLEQVHLEIKSGYGLSLEAELTNA